MSFLIPTKTDLPRYDFEIELEGATYTFSFDWNDRDEGWYLSVFNAAKNPLIQGRRIVIQYPLLDPHRDSQLPPGVLLADDTSGQNIEPGFEDLGGRVKLLYFSSAEI